MKIILANWVSNWGSTGYILRDIKNGLALEGHEVYAVSGIDKGGVKDDTMILSKRWHLSIFARLIKIGRAKFSGDTIATVKFVRLIKSLQPDIVHLHLLHCATFDLYALLKWLGKNNIKTVITHHAELYYTGSCGYSFDCTEWIDNQCVGCDNPKAATGAILFANPNRNYLKLKKALSYFKPDNLIYTSVSPWVKQRFSLSPFSKGFDCEVVMNGVETSVFKFDAEIKSDKFLPEKYAIYVSAVFDATNKNDIKGGWYLTEIAKSLPDIKFVVVATEVRNAESLPPNIVLLGKAKDQEELACLYSKAQVTVLTSKRETFSMICAESLCCGTPVVGFLSGGPESIAIPEYSRFVEYGNIPQLGERLRQMYNTDYNPEEISRHASLLYSKSAMTKGYEAVYNKLLNKLTT